MPRYDTTYNFGFVSLTSQPKIERSNSQPVFEASLAGAQITIKALRFSCNGLLSKGFLYLSSLLSVSATPFSSDKLGNLIIYSANHKNKFIAFLCGLIFSGLKTGSKIQRVWKLSRIGLATTFTK